MTRRPFEVLAVTILLSACSSGNSESSDASFCTAIDFWDASLTTMGEGISGLEMTISTAEGSEEYPTSDAIRELARDTIAAADDADKYLATAIANSSDAKVSDDLREGHDLVIDYARWIANVGLDAGDAAEFSTDILQELDRVNQFYISLNALDGSLVEEYINSTCRDDDAPGRAFSPRAQDTDAKMDASTLGKEIAIYYVDHGEGDPDPTITISGEDYYLLDTNIGPHQRQRHRHRPVLQQPQRLVRRGYE